ncbi:MAG: NAD(P)H-binding protein, partial [Chitinophagales bacterium]
MKTALLFGGTGLIGKELLKRLANDPHYGLIKVFVRRKMTIKLLNVEMVEMNFEKLNESSSLISGDDCFCALGTTMRKAGSREAFRKVDFDHVVAIAKLAKQNGVKRFIVVSSIGADASSSNFYLRTKGEMEDALKQLSFEQLIIIRPSILLGKRNEFRLGERIGIFFARILSPLMFGP